MADLVCVSDYEKKAKENLGRTAKVYLNSGADEELTLHDNMEALKRIRLRPRMLRDVTNREIHTSVLGHPVSIPIGIAPSAFHGLFCPVGETATAKAARTISCCYIMSSIATRSVEEIAKATPDSLKWFQIYINKNRDITMNSIKRARDAGFEALVFTVDSPVVGKKRRDTFAGDLDRPMWQGSTKIDPSVTWHDIWWLKKESELPVVVKGILTAEDTELAIQHGADAVYVSNHGGRQLDTVQASIDALPEVVAAARGRVEVYMDGGIRTGIDVLKALALGARAVFVGRPVIWGLASKGQQGVHEVLLLLKDEFSSAMALSDKAVRPLTGHKSLPLDMETSNFTSWEVSGKSFRKPEIKDVDLWMRLTVAIFNMAQGCDVDVTEHAGIPYIRFILD